MLSLYRALAGLRRAEPALHGGDYRPVEAGESEVFAYLRNSPGADGFLVVLNFGSETRLLDLGSVAPSATIAIATGLVRQGEVQLSALSLEPNEGLVLRLSASNPQ
jgi:alpha-glucosidase